MMLFLGACTGEPWGRSTNSQSQQCTLKPRTWTRTKGGCSQDASLISHEAG